MSGTHVAEGLHEAVNGDAHTFNRVVEWLHEVCADWAVGYAGEIHAPSLPWLVECLMFWDGPA